MTLQCHAMSPEDERACCRQLLMIANNDVLTDIVHSACNEYMTVGGADSTTQVSLKPWSAHHDPIAYNRLTAVLRTKRTVQDDRLKFAVSCRSTGDDVTDIGRKLKLLRNDCERQNSRRNHASFQHYDDTREYMRQYRTHRYVCNTGIVCNSYKTVKVVAQYVSAFGPQRTVTFRWIENYGL